MITNLLLNRFLYILVQTEQGFNLCVTLFYNLMPSTD